jgi:hypothetical protein
MIRILFWNINNFSLGKIYDNDTRSDIELSEAEKATDRLKHILMEVFYVTNPDIFVIVEVFGRATDGSEGTLFTPQSDAVTGLELLLNLMRVFYGNTWCLVPPINLGAIGPREGVAVFYNSRNLQFIGPYILNNTDTIYSACSLSGAKWKNRAAYPKEFINFLPNPNNPIEELRQNRTYRVTKNSTVYEIPEYVFAGQWEYYKIGPDEGLERIGFPNTLADNDNTNTYYFRSPFLTSFLDLTDTATDKRIINLFSVHTSPRYAVEAVRNLALVPQIKYADDNSVNVIAGDFNVDSFDMKKNGAYSGILDKKYKMHLDPRDTTSNPNTNRKPYCMTHFLPVGQATPFNNIDHTTDERHNVYPRFGYTGQYIANRLSGTGAIDNIFTLYGRNLHRPNPTDHNISVVNTITGKPYDQLDAIHSADRTDHTPAGVTAELTGGLIYGRAIKDQFPIPAGIKDNNDEASALSKLLFGEWENFGRIHSTSDHMAVSIDI